LQAPSISSRFIGAFQGKHRADIVRLPWTTAPHGGFVSARKNVAAMAQTSSLPDKRRRRLRQHRQHRLRTSKARLADRLDHSSIEKIDYFGFVLPKLDFLYF
jgi:hypothetical protein